MSDSCSHNHDHSHTHSHTHHNEVGGHSHAPASFGKAFMIGITLNLLFIVAEVIYGLGANSLALLADAGHNAGDVLGLFMAWGATVLAKVKPTPRYTYGLQSSSILAGVANAMLLMVAIGGIIWESILRLGHPEIVASYTVMAVAGVGIFINGITAWLFMSGSKDDLNIRGAYLHMATDAIVSLGVVLAGLIMLVTSWAWLDPVVSIVIGLVIIIGTWGLLKDSLNLSLHGVPAHIDAVAVKAYLSGLPDVKEVHDLHIWAMSTNQFALSAHLLMREGHPGDGFLHQVSHELEERFRIHHPTIQIELGGHHDDCALAPDNVI